MNQLNKIQNKLNEAVMNIASLQDELDALKSNLSEKPNSCDPNPYAVDWSNAPDWADVHCFDYDGIGKWGGFKKYGNDWYIEGLKSPFTLPSNLDWTKSKTTRPCK